MVRPRNVYAWSPPVAGIAEVLHARFTDHAYPMHLHDTWTLLVVTDGAVRYHLDRREHAADDQSVTLLPPNVPHDGTAASAHGFGKRVLYLDAGQLDDRLVGPAVARPRLVDPVLRRRVDLLHRMLATPGEEPAAELHLAFVAERLRAHLAGGWASRPTRVRDPRLAGRLRDLVDARVVEGVTLREASELLDASVTYLVRVFSREFGLAPHQYLISRRVDLARRLLADGLPAAEVAVAVGFYDQSHLSRHFRRILGFCPGQYAPTGRTARPAARHRPGHPASG